MGLQISRYGIFSLQILRAPCEEHIAGIFQGIHNLRLLKKIRFFFEQKWLFARAPKGVLEKNEKGLKNHLSPLIW
jgi:hypothetical protein